MSTDNVDGRIPSVPSVPSIPGDPAELRKIAKLLEAAGRDLTEGGHHLGPISGELSKIRESHEASSVSAGGSGPAADNSAEAIVQAALSLASLIPALAQLRAEEDAAEAELEEARDHGAAALDLLLSQPLPANDPYLAAQRRYAEQAIHDQVDAAAWVAAGKLDGALERYYAAVQTMAAEISAVTSPLTQEGKPTEKPTGT